MKNVRIPLNMYLQKKNIFTLQEQADETKYYFKNKLVNARIRAKTPIKNYNATVSINVTVDPFALDTVNNQAKCISHLPDTFVYHDTLSTALVSREFIIYDRRIY